MPGAPVTSTARAIGSPTHSSSSPPSSAELALAADARRRLAEQRARDLDADRARRAIIRPASSPRDVEARVEQARGDLVDARHATPRRARRSARRAIDRLADRPAARDHAAPGRERHRRASARSACSASAQRAASPPDRSRAPLPSSVTTNEPSTMRSRLPPCSCATSRSAAASRCRRSGSRSAA